MPYTTDEMNEVTRIGIRWKDVVQALFDDTDDYDAVKWWTVREVTTLAQDLNPTLPVTTSTVRQWLARNHQNNLFRKVQRHAENSGRLVNCYLPLLSLREKYGFKTKQAGIQFVHQPSNNWKSTR